MIALHLVPPLGPVRIARLLQTFSSARGAAEASEKDLAAVPGIGRRLAARIVGDRSSVDVDAELRRAAAVGARVQTWFDGGYPARLRDLRDAPPVVYLRGAWDGPAEPVVAIVGTRRPSPYGLDVAGGLGEGAR